MRELKFGTIFSRHRDSGDSSLRSNSLPSVREARSQAIEKKDITLGQPSRLQFTMKGSGGWHLGRSRGRSIPTGYVSARMSLVLELTVRLGRKSNTSILLYSSAQHVECVC